MNHASHGIGAPSTADGLSVAREGYSLVPAERYFQSGGVQELRFQILDADGNAVVDYVEQHEHDLHLVVVRRDMSYFQHLHPRFDGAAWSAEVDFREGGAYRAFADFTTGDLAFVLGVDLLVAGYFDPQQVGEPSSVVGVDGRSVAMSAAGLAPAQPAELTFSVTRNGELVALTPVMGALGHLIALREGDLAYVHAHPLEGNDKGEIRFHVTLPSPGRYRLFLQFADAGHRLTAPFTVVV